MVRFIIYLFETGLCLSLLYLAYWLFLRKETYFNFNRTFLTGSILLALTVPLLHLNFMVPRGSTWESSAQTSRPAPSTTQKRASRNGNAQNR